MMMYHEWSIDQKLDIKMILNKNNGRSEKCIGKKKKKTQKMNSIKTNT